MPFGWLGADELREIDVHCKKIHNGVCIIVSPDTLSVHSRIDDVRVSDTVMRTLVTELSRANPHLRFPFHSTKVCVCTGGRCRVDHKLIVSSVNAIPHYQVCNMLTNERLVSFGVAVSNTSLRRVCKSVSSALRT